MSTVDHIVPTHLSADAHTRRIRVIRRALLCLSVGALEGLAAVALILAVAIVYHRAALAELPGDFPLRFYIAFALLVGLMQAGFGAAELSSFLRKERRPRLRLEAGLYGWTSAFAFTLLLAFLAGRIGDLSRVTLTGAYILGIPLTLVLRDRLHHLVGARIRSGELHYESVAVIGNRVDALAFLLDGELWRQGYTVASTLYFEDLRDNAGKLRAEAIAEFAAECLRAGTNHIVLVGPLSDLDEIAGIVAALKRFALNLLYAPANRGEELRVLDVVAIGPNNLLRLLRTPMSTPAVVAKRAFDLLGATLGLMLLWPVFLLVALAIRLDSPGPALYRQARRGFNGEPFMIWKFRSMSVTESGTRMVQAREGDPRITRVGRFLRRTSLDELPQLFNVLSGEMSLVGPRPHALSHDEELSRQMASYAHRQRIKPGITGWAQVNGLRGETSRYEQIEARVVHDIEYIENWSLLFDLWIVLLTVFSPLAWRNAR